MEPAPLGAFEWSEIGKLLTSLWFMVLFIVLFAASMLIGHNSIPSLVASGHLARSWEKARVPIYAVTFTCFGLAMFFLVQVVDLAGVLRRFWEDYWI